MFGLSIDAEDALLEYLDTFYHLGLAGRALDRVGAVDFATSIAPGPARRAADRQGLRGGPAAGEEACPTPTTRSCSTRPPTGRIAQFLNVHQAVAGLAKMGPIRNQADSIMRVLRSATTVVHLVTLLEDMPVTETEEAVVALAPTKIRVGTVIANMVDPEPAEPTSSPKRQPANVAARRCQGWSSPDRTRRWPREYAVDAARTLRAAAPARSGWPGSAVPMVEIAFDPAGIDRGALFSIAGQLPIS